MISSGRVGSVWQTILYTVGICSCLLWALVVDSVHEVLVLVAFAAPLPAILLIGFRDLPRWVFELVMAFANALIAAAIWQTGDPSSPYALLFLWATPYAFAFYARRQALRQLGWVTVAYAAALALLRGGFASEDALRVLMLSGTLCSVSLVIWRLRQALTASAQRFRHGFENAVVGMCLVAPDGRFLRANGALAQMFGVPPEEIAAMRVADVSHPADLRRLVGPLEQALSGGEPAFEFEARYARRGEGYRWALFSTSLVRDGEGRPLHFYGQLQDIHERKLTEVQIQQRAAQQAAVAALGQRALAGAEPEALIEEAADAVAATLGVDRSAVIELLRRLGPLDALTALPGSFTPDDVNFLRSVANVLATAIERRRSEEDVRHRALHDSVTGLPNRTLFMDRLAHALQRAERGSSATAVLFLDLDNFKVVNDSLGHQAGDELLCSIAPRLDETLRAADTVARFGGDEFVVLLEDLSGVAEAIEIAERVVCAFERPVMLAGAEHVVTASIGVAVAGLAGTSAEALVRDADAAMYRAKDRGRARYEVFDGEMRERAVERLRIEAGLRRALEREELFLRYQPVVSLANGELAAVEALVRWKHPERGTMSPGTFIPVAEESGLIVPIGEWVLREACRQAVEWAAAHPGAKPLMVSVNLSARQLAEPDLPRVVASALDESGLEPHLLGLELTESVLMEDAEAAVDTARALRALGVRLVLDDFGTGYSSLGYVKRFPIDVLKLDRSFVGGLGPGSTDSAIVAAVVGMARELRVNVVAEGVENEEQLDQLAGLGCGFVQGFWFSPPVAPAAVDGLLAGNLPWRSGRASAPAA